MGEDLARVEMAIKAAMPPGIIEPGLCHALAVAAIVALAERPSDAVLAALMYETPSPYDQSSEDKNAYAEMFSAAIKAILEDDAVNATLAFEL